MVDILIDGDGNSVDLPDEDEDEVSLDSYGDPSGPSEEPEAQPKQAPQQLRKGGPRQQQKPEQQKTIPLTITPSEATAEEIFNKLFTEGFDFNPGGLQALQEMVDLPYPTGLLAEGLDEAVLTLSEGFFAEEPYVGIKTFLDNDDEIREIVALDFLTVFEEQGQNEEAAFGEMDLRELLPLLLLLSGRALHEEPLPPGAELIMADFWEELDLGPDASTADLDRVATWWYQSRLPSEGVLQGLRKVLHHYQRPGRLPR